MHNSFEHRLDAKYIEALMYEPSLHKKAQEASEGISSTIQAELSKVYDPEHPVESILAFVGPGILWMLGLRWVTVLYGLAQALGFDWEHFFVSIREKLEPILNSLLDGGNPSTAESKNIIETAASGAMSGQIDPEKVREEIEKSGSISEMLFIKKLAKSGEDPWIYEKILKWIGGIGGNKLRKGVLGVVVKIFSWVLSAVIISAGVLFASHAASSALGIKKDETNDQDNTSTTENGTSANGHSGKHLELNLNTKADPALFNESFNDGSHVWIINYNINNIKDKLVEWAQELYPQLTDKNAFSSSSAFNNTLKLFQNRNKNSQLDMIAVPQPFTSIKSIVNSFAADVAAHTES